jgi:conjugal transfer pilus assembly protein TraF
MCFRTLFVSCFVTLLCIPLSAFADPSSDPQFWQSRQDGWHWYKDPPPPVKQVPRPAPNTSSGPIPSHLTSKDMRDLDAFKLFQKQVEDYHNVAVINPTPENTKRAMEYRYKALQVAGTFDDRSREASLVSPQFTFDADPNVRPTDTMSMQAFDLQRKSSQETMIRSLAKTHGIYFFFRSDCPYCHAYAPFLRNFAEKFGLAIFAISMDGGPIPAFPNAPADNGMALKIARQLGIPMDQFRVPATFLARPPQLDSIIPLGFGVLNDAEMLDRISLVTRPKVANR